MSRRDDATAARPHGMGDPGVLEDGDDTVSACGACGRVLRGTEPGTDHYCPHTYRRRTTRALTDEEREDLEDSDRYIADPAGRER